MAEGYDCFGNGDCSSSWLDEFLCEYVDGTMDPTVRMVFEEYLSTDPVLAQQVERLRCTRTLLCRHGCQTHTPRGLQARVRRRLACEMARPEPPYFPQAASRLGTFVTVGSVVAAFAMMGVLVGALWLTQDPAPVAERTPLPMVHQQAFGGLQPAAMTPLMGQPPPNLPSLFGQPGVTALPLTSPYSRRPEALFNGHGATLQRTGGTP